MCLWAGRFCLPKCLSPGTGCWRGVLVAAVVLERQQDIRGLDDEPVVVVVFLAFCSFARNWAFFIRLEVWWYETGEYTLPTDPSL